LSGIAAKVAREFFEALIAQDYEKAGLLYAGMPAARMSLFAPQACLVT
jgi:hypothetical protein